MSKIITGDIVDTPKGKVVVGDYYNYDEKNDVLYNPNNPDDCIYQFEIISEVKKLAEISGKIKYEIPFHLSYYGIEDRDDYFIDENGDAIYRRVHVNEVIFNQDFLRKYVQYILKQNPGFKLNSFYIELLHDGLINPVDYLYTIYFQNS